MQYSCAYWKKATTLEEAQQDKLRLISEKLQLQPGMRVLDIGCGWGGLAYFMAKHYGVSVVGVTISAEQQKWPGSAARVSTLISVCRITATSTSSLIALFPWACLSTWGRKLRHLF